MITYDRYYQTPRLWLQGTRADGVPLMPNEIMTDISAEHARKTVTIETFPFFKRSTNCASIHPCRHAHVMHKINTKGKRSAQHIGARVDQYLILFLKFMSSIVPTVEYDNTLSIP